ncbi:MAG TPA: tRNA preQ1(34) S-adenosylmethionine ribosyltransferase-isomerase QueA [Candidatus Azoamicus sp. OHIO1]
MLTELFNYQLDKKYIANIPKQNRSKSKLLILNKKTNDIQHKKFEHIEEIFNKNDILILNNTYVNSVKIICKKNTKGKVTIFIEKIISTFEGIGLIKTNKKIHKITKLILENNIEIIIEKYKNNLYKIYTKKIKLITIIKKFGIPPTPSYIKENNQYIDKKRYQTLYAKKKGSIAAPTAGLHFCKKLLEKLKKKGIKICYITLHIGSGTFNPITKKNINFHKMHFEYINISKKTCNEIESAKKTGNRIFACGTTTLRAIESAALDGKIKQFKGETNLFIKPGFKFNVITALITNFHLPKSTLLVLVSAFSDLKTIIKTYQIAIKNNYKFYSYGDAMLIYQ